MKYYNISFVLCSHNACSCSEICLCFYFDMNYYFSLDGSVATQAQGQLPSHDRTGELGESISHRTVPPDLNPGCLCGEYNWQSNSTRHFPFMWAVVEQLELSLFCCWTLCLSCLLKNYPSIDPSPAHHAVGSVLFLQSVLALSYFSTFRLFMKKIVRPRTLEGEKGSHLP